MNQYRIVAILKTGHTLYGDTGPSERNLEEEVNILGSEMAKRSEPNAVMTAGSYVFRLDNLAFIRIEQVLEVTDPIERYMQANPRELQKIKDWLNRGFRINAIREVRSLTQCALTDAKDFVDRIHPPFTD
jgi:hypothetical protein